MMDKKKCLRCGLCAEVCKRGVLEVVGDEEAPGGKDIIVARPELCVRCGLCVALCPAKALATKK